jgi:hypothetical protein
MRTTELEFGKAQVLYWDLDDLAADRPLSNS